MMRQSTRLMSFSAGTMVTVKGHPFVLRDAAAVMGTPENFGSAMCELAKAEQMQDQAMADLKCDSVGEVEMTVTLTPEAIEAAKDLFPAKGEVAPCGKAYGVVYNEGGLLVLDDTQKKGHSYLADDGYGNAVGHVFFQNGPVPENGVNGLTNEALLAILIHRTNILNEQFPCNENSEAIVLISSPPNPVL